jgi:hypothetical protein
MNIIFWSVKFFFFESLNIFEVFERIFFMHEQFLNLVNIIQTMWNILNMKEIESINIFFEILNNLSNAWTFFKIIYSSFLIHERIFEPTNIFKYHEYFFVSMIIFCERISFKQ